MLDKQSVLPALQIVIHVKIMIMNVLLVAFWEG